MKLKKVIHDLNNNKAGGGKIPVKNWKNCSCIFDILKNCINKSTETPNFPDCLKTANIKPVFKKDSPLDKLNDRSLSILLLLSKRLWEFNL